MWTSDMRQDERKSNEIAINIICAISNRDEIM